MALAFLLVALLTAALGLLHTPFGRTAARVALEAWLSRATGGTLRVGRLDLDLLQGRAGLVAPNLLLPPGTRIDAQALQLDWSPWEGARVSLLRPVVRVAAEAEPARERPPATGLATQPWRALERLARLSVEDGRVELRDAASRPWLVLAGIELQASGGERASGSLRITDASLGWPGGGLRVRPARAEAVLRVEGGALVVESLRMRTGGASALDLGGRLERILPVTAAASVQAAFDGVLVAQLAPGARTSGRVTASAQIEVEDGRATGPFGAECEALAVEGVGPWAARARARFDGARLVVESLAARGFGGRVEAEGELALGPGVRTDVRLRVADLDLDALVRAPSGAGAPLAARASGSLRWSTTGWEIGAARGEGRVSLRPGPGTGLRPLGEVPLRIAGRTLEIASARIEVRGAQVAASAEISGDGALRGRFTSELPLASLPALLADLGQPPRSVPFEGSIRAEGELGGTLAQPEAAVRMAGHSLAVRGDPIALGAEGRYEPGGLSLAPLVLRAGAGRATVTGSVPLRAAGEWRLEGAIERLDAEPLLALVGIDGHGPVTGTIRVSGPRDEPASHAALRASLALRRAEAVPGATEPGTTDPETNEAGVEVTLEARSQGMYVEIDRLRAELAGGRAEASGRYDAASSELDVRVTLAAVDWQRLPLLPARVRRLRGTLAGELQVSGRTASPVGELRLTLADPRLGDARLPALALAARADGRELRVSGTAGAAFLSGSAPLTGDWPLRAELDVAALPLAALLDAWPAAREAHATVTASGTLAIELPLRRPAQLRYASADLAVSGRLRRLEWRTPPFGLRGDRESAELRGLRLDAGKSWLAARGRIALAPEAANDLALQGQLDLEALDLALPGRTLGGTGELELRVAGSFAGVRGRYEGARFRDLDLAARFAGRELLVERMEATVLGGRLRASGALPLVAPGRAGGAGPSRLVFELADLDLARLLDRELRETADSPSLIASLDGELRTAGPSLEALSAHGRLTRLETRSLEGGVALVTPVAWSLERGTLAVEPVRLLGTLGALEARVDGRFGARAPRGEASLKGRIDLRALSPFLPDTSAAGPATIDARASYEAGAWRLAGGVQVEDARLSLDSLNFTATEIAGAVRFEGDRVSLDASGAAGDGRLRATGGIRLGPAPLGRVELQLEAERVPIQHPPGFRGRATGKLQLAGEAGRYRLTGDVALRQGYYTAEFDAKSRSLDRLDWQLGALEGGSLTDRVALAADLRLAEPVRVRNSTMTVDVEGAFAASGTLAQPVAEGTLALREGGELVLGRGRVRVAEGRIELDGYPARTPELDFQGQTGVSGTLVGIRARGALDDLELTLASDRTDLSQTDLVSLLLTGRTAKGAASQGGAVVAEQLAVALGGVLQKGVGETILIDVAPDRSSLTDDIDPTQRFKIGTRVTQDLSVVYSTALDGTAQRWIVELNPGGGRFRVRGITEEDNSFSIEGSDRVSFELWNRRSRARGAPEIERLAALRFEGTLPVAEDDLRRAAKLKLRGRYSVLQREQAAERVRERLARAGCLSASVEATSLPAKGGVALVLRVEAGPLVRIAWSGDDPGGQTKKEAEKAFSGYQSKEAAAARVARVALHRLQADGYYGASVTPEAEAAEGRVDVKLRVARGAKGTSVAVDFEGNRALSDEALVAALPRPGSLEFFEALDPRSARIGNAVRLAYAGIGHLRARVSTPRSVFDPQTGRLSVTIPVRERSAATITAIELPPEMEQLDAPPPALRLREGQAFDLSVYVADRDALGAWYRAQGFVGAHASGTLEASGDSVTVHFQVDPGPRPRIGSIRVLDTGNTRPGLIRRSLQLREGDYLQPAAIAETRERLSDLGVFRSVDVRSEARPENDALRDVVVGLVHKPDVQLEYGLRYTTSGSAATGEAPSTTEGGELQAAAAIELNNPFGYGVNTRAHAFFTTSRTTSGVTLDAATLVGRRVRTQLSVFDDDDDLIDIEGLDSRVRGVSVLQSRALLRDRRGRRFYDRLRLQWGYTYKTIDYLASEGGEVLPLGHRGFIPLALIGDERDSLTDPRRGVFWTATSEFARTWLGSDVDYVRLYGQLFAYVPLGPLVWAQGYRAGVVPGDFTLLLIENRFRAGGPTTVRGFEQNAAGPQSPSGLSLGGQAVAVFNQELRFPIFRSLKGGVFWDAGNTWITAAEWSLGDLRHSAGLGLRFMFPFGPLRLEYAWILDRRSGEPRGRLVFGLGHAF
jgi:outer membrane protein insertion porin family